MSESVVHGTGVASKDLPNGWQVNVGNLGSSVQLRKARLSFVKSVPEEPPGTAPDAPPPVPPPLAKAWPGPGLLPMAAVANAALGGLSLVSSFVASAGDTPGALVAILFGATAALFSNAGLLFVWAQKK